MIYYSSPRTQKSLRLWKKKVYHHVQAVVAPKEEISCGWRGTDKTRIGMMVSYAHWLDQR
jgi:hypothetical protein